MKTINEGHTSKEKEKKVSTLEGVICSNPGDRIAPVYKRVYDKDYDSTLVKQVDTFDIEEFIQSSKSSTDLAVLQKRFIELGEIPAVDANMGSNDLTVYPSNIHEVYDMVNDVASNFAKLPQSIQAIFGTKEAYMKALLDGTYQATLINAINQIPKEEQQPAPEGDK